MRRVIVAAVLIVGALGATTAPADEGTVVRYGAKGCVLQGSGSCDFNVSGGIPYDRGWGGLFAGTASITHKVACDPAVDGAQCVRQADGSYKKTVTDVTFNSASSSCNSCFNKPASFAGLQDGIDYTLRCAGCIGFVAAGALEP